MGRTLAQKYSYLGEQIGDRNVIDIGCGDCFLARYVKRGAYTGLDINKFFVEVAKAKGIEASVFDVRYDPVPEADVIVLSNILHQLYPEHESVLRRAVSAARYKVIVCEPVRHIASSGNPLVAWIARMMNDPGYGSPRARLSGAELFALFSRHGASSVSMIGREAIAVFDGADNAAFV